MVFYFLKNMLTQDNQTISLKNKWHPLVKRKLTNALSSNYVKDGYAVFDFDNTLIGFDVNEAVLGQLLLDQKISREKLPQHLQLIKFIDTEINECLISYYERLCEKDPQTAYTWIIKIFSTLTVKDIEQATIYCFNWKQPYKYYSVAKKKYSYIYKPQPYPAMQELIKYCHQNKVQTFIVSASNIWSVRWAANKYFSIPEKNVIAISPYIKNKDKVISSLDITNDKSLDYQITDKLSFPATTFNGKTKAITKFISKNKKPLLVCGDSSNDYAMMFDSNSNPNTLCLWIDKKETDTAATKALVAAKSQYPNNWLFQKANPLKYEFIAS